MMDYENKIRYEGLSSTTSMYVFCENAPYIVKGVLWQNEFVELLFNFLYYMFG